MANFIKSVASGLALTLFLLSCSNEPNQGVHPDYDQLPKENEVAYSVNLYDEASPFPIPFFAGLSPERLRIGNDSLLTNEYYGMVPGRMDIDDTGRIYITQWTKNTINVYSPNGDYLYSIGQQGHGPGEFIQLQYFIFDSTYATMYVLDRFKVDVFKRKDDGTFEYNTSFNHDLFLGGQLAASMCMLGENLYISGFTNSYEEDEKEMMKGINIIDMNTKEQVNSFGYVYETYHNWMVTMRVLSHMHITCNEQTNTVVAQHHDFPFLFGYSAEGEQKWISRIDNFISAEFPETKEGHMGHRTNEGVFHFFIPFRAVDLNEYELFHVTYSYPHPRDNIELNDPNNFAVLVHSDTGELYTDGSLPIIGAIKNSIHITIDREITSESFINTLYLDKN